jgi:surfeit locus 1 family protein
MILSVIFQDIKKRPIACIAMIFLLILGINLGLWQLRRAETKIHQAQEISLKGKLMPLDANSKRWNLDEALYHRMLATGYWIPEQALWLENRPHPLGKDPKTGIATGFNLLVPLRLDTDKKTILWVNRGWTARDFQEINRVPDIFFDKNKITIEGIVFPDSGKTYQLAAEVENRASDGRKIQENLVLKDDRTFGNQLLPFVLREQSTQNTESLDQTLPILKTGVNTHYGYAFQWFSLSLMTFLYWLFSIFRKRSQSLR